VPNFKALRKDYYMVYFEAKDLEDAKKKLRLEDDDADYLMNSGSFAESVFEKETLEEENYE
jgi:hypothetical protein